MRFWGGVSAAVHVAALVLGLIFGLPRPLREPEEQAVAVEIVNPGPAETAQGEQPAPVAAPASAPQPPRPEPPAPTPQQESIPTPPPPPPPPPPAPAPPPVPQQQAQARPTPPAPPPEPSPLPLPPPPPRPPQPQAQPQPRPEPPRPAPPRPEPPRPTPPTPVPPPPTPSQQAGTGQTPPVQRPQERSRSVLNTLENLRSAQRQTEAPRARPSPQSGAPQQGGGTPTGTASLSSGEKAGLAEKISECWSVDGGGVGVREVIVELRVVVDAGGVVRNVTSNGAVPSDPRARSVYEAARRALLDPRCNPLPLPRERLAALRDTVFRFNPRDLGLR
jgi:hypothetical protein